MRFFWEWTALSVKTEGADYYFATLEGGGEVGD